MQTSQDSRVESHFKFICESKPLLSTLDSLGTTIFMDILTLKNFS